MCLVFMTFLAMLAVLAGMAWFCWRRLSAHARRHPEASAAWFEHVVKPLLRVEKDEPKGEGDAKATG